MESKKHHYVPVCYLKQFSYDNDQLLHVFDKITGKQFVKNAGDILYETSFYRLSDGFLSSQQDFTLNNLSVEKSFFAETIESDYLEVLNWIRNETDTRYNDKCFYFGLTDESKWIIARYIIIQYLRTPTIRHRVVSETQYVEEKMIRLFKQGLSHELKKPEMANLPIASVIDEVATHVTMTFMDEKQVNSIAEYLSKCYWHFYYSSKEELYTSDHPVNIIHRCKDVVEQNWGLTDYGAEIMVPLNPKLLLSIYDYRYYNMYSSTDGLFEEASKDHIDYANACQYAFSQRFLVDKLGGFEIAKKMKAIDENKTG